MAKNVLMISVDDLNDWVTVASSYPGTVHTPNFDALMSRGVTFTNAFAQNAECSPSRTSILTGKTPMQTGIQDNLIDWFDEVPLSETLHAVMRGAGYHTVGTGKVYHTPNFGNAIKQALFDAYQSDTTGFGGNGFLRQTGVYPSGAPLLGDEVNTQYAVDFLNGFNPAAGAPFFLSLGIFRPHKDWAVPQEYFDLYPLNQIVLPEVLAGDVNDLPDFAKTLLFQNFHQGVLADNDWARLVQGYLASISFADAMLGRVLAAVDANGLAENTTIMLWSDHGFHLGDKENWNKETLWDESTRAPLIIVDPDVGAPGAQVDRMVELLDIFPTILDLVGLDAATLAPWLEGDSLRPLLADPDAAWEDAAFSQRNGGFSVRTPLYRYIRYPDGSEELYDMVADPRQWTNIAADPAFAAVKVGLEALLDVYLAEHRVLASSADGEVLVGSGERDFLVAGHEVTLRGGGGDDIYMLVDTNATIVETAAGGIDEVLPFGNIVLPDFVENVHAPKAKEGLPKVFRIEGNALDNRILGSNGNNLLLGRGGGDLIDGRGNDDTIFGGAGADTILGDIGKDTLSGDAGNDFLSGDAGNDTYLYSGDGTDSDVISDSRGAADTLRFDCVDAFDLVKQVERADTDLILRFAAGGGIIVDEFFSGDVVEFLESGGERFAMDAGFTGAPVSLAQYLGVAGPTNGDDTLTGTPGDDTLNGLGGNDTLDGEGGDDLLVGGGGDDRLLGRAGSDILSGRGGEDHLGGGGGADILQGGGGNDVLRGGGGDDVLNGHGMNDRLVGGAGADHFRFKGGFGNDTVTDFSQAGGDRLFLATNLGVNTFAGLDTNGNGRLDGADGRVAITGGDTVITFAGLGQLTVIGVTNLMADDLVFF